MVKLKNIDLNKIVNKKSILIILAIVVILLIVVASIFYIKNMNTIKTYTNSELGWTVQYSSSIKMYSSDNTFIFKNENPKYIFQVQILPIQAFAETDSLDDITDQMLNGTEAGVDNFQFIGSKKIQYQGFSANRTQSTFQYKGDKQVLMADEVFLVKNDNIFRISTIFDNNVTELDQKLKNMVNSFKLIK